MAVTRSKRWPHVQRAHIVFALQAAGVGFAAALLYVLVNETLLAPAPTVQIVQASAPARQDPGLAGGTFSYASAVNAAAPAVVNIYTTTKLNRAQGFDTPLFQQLFGDHSGLGAVGNVRTGAGSGVIIASTGYIVTNNHLIADADEINVMLTSGASYQARVIGADPESDLAVLGIEAGTLPAITLAAADSLRVGDVVLAIGNPLGAGQTVTMGIVSATGRTGVGLNTFEDFIQTDAAINPGNSGGALINPRGELVGVNTAIFTQNNGGSSGLGLAIPASLVQSVTAQIIAHGRVIRGWLGVAIRDLAPPSADLGLPPEGVLVTGVMEGGPAQRAGIRTGDVLTEANGNRIHNARELLEITTMAEPGSTVLVRGIRAGREFHTTARLVQRPLPETRP